MSILSSLVELYYSVFSFFFGDLNSPIVLYFGVIILTIIPFRLLYSLLNRS